MKLRLLRGGGGGLRPPAKRRDPLRSGEPYATLDALRALGLELDAPTPEELAHLDRVWNELVSGVAADIDAVDLDQVIDHDVFVFDPPAPDPDEMRALRRRAAFRVLEGGRAKS